MCSVTMYKRQQNVFKIVHESKQLNNNVKLLIITYYQHNINDN